MNVCRCVPLSRLKFVLTCRKWSAKEDSGGDEDIAGRIPDAFLETLLAQFFQQQGVMDGSEKIAMTEIFVATNISPDASHW
jgi:hypothetical protein